MKQLSLAFKNEIFVIKGDGKEKEDVWRAFVRKGEIFYQKSYIAYPNIPPELLIQLNDESRQELLNLE